MSHDHNTIRLLISQYLEELLNGDYLSNEYQSHTFEPEVGDYVENINQGCKHFESEGQVLAVDDLPGGKGKTCTYKVINYGDTFQPGDILIKTLDQLAPLEE